MKRQAEGLWSVLGSSADIALGKGLEEPMWSSWQVEGFSFVQNLEGSIIEVEVDIGDYVEAMATWKERRVHKGEGKVNLDLRFIRCLEKSWPPPYAPG